MKRYLFIIIKHINMYLIGLLLSAIYILMIVPYHLFLSKNNNKWIKKEKEMDNDFKYMW